MLVPRQILPDASEFGVFRVIYIGTSDSNVVCESTKPKRLFIVKNYKVAFVNVDRELFSCFQCSTSTSSSVANFTRSITLGLI